MRTTVFDRPMSEALARLRAAMAETSPLDGPHLTGREICDNRDMPGYAIPLPPFGPQPRPSSSKTTQRMSRLLAGQED